MEAAPVAVVDLKVQEEPVPEVAVPVLAAVAVEEAPVAAVMAVTEETAAETPKTRIPVLKGLAKLVRVIYAPWVAFFKSLSKLLRFLYLPWLAMIPKLSKSS
jgi:hypothetical protein